MVLNLFRSPGGPVFNASETVVEYIPSPHQLPADHSESTPPVGVPIVIAPAVNREAVGQVIWNAGFFCGAACPSCKQIGSVRSSVYADGYAVSSTRLFGGKLLKSS